jgi:hypothetical protein
VEPGCLVSGAIKWVSSCLIDTIKSINEKFIQMLSTAYIVTPSATARHLFNLTALAAVEAAQV